MIRNITLKINGRDFSDRLSTFLHTEEVTYARTITTLNGHEFVGGKQIRDVLTFKLWPRSDDTVREDFKALSADSLSVTFSAPDFLDGTMNDVEMRLTSNIKNAFALNSIDGHIYYTGEKIVLRASKVRVT